MVAEVAGSEGLTARLGSAEYARRVEGHRDGPYNGMMGSRHWHPHPVEASPARENRPHKTRCIPMLSNGNAAETP